MPDGEESMNDKEYKGYRYRGIELTIMGPYHLWLIHQIMRLAAESFLNNVDDMESDEQLQTHWPGPSGMARIR
jgi:hypothetical protein